MNKTSRPNPFTLLIYSRKFWLLVANTITTLALYFVTLLKPDYIEHVKFVIASLTALFMFVIGTITVEDVARGSK